VVRGTCPLDRQLSPHRLAAQVTAPSRRGREFKSRWGSQARACIVIDTTRSSWSSVPVRPHKPGHAGSNPASATMGELARAQPRTLGEPAAFESRLVHEEALPAPLRPGRIWVYAARAASRGTPPAPRTGRSGRIATAVWCAEPPPAGPEEGDPHSGVAQRQSGVLLSRRSLVRSQSSERKSNGGVAQHGQSTGLSRRASPVQIRSSPPWSLSSAVERYPDTVDAGGSIPPATTQDMHQWRSG
jgi:hypothetical protein